MQIHIINMQKHVNIILQINKLDVQIFIKNAK
jgi:hypothetical protein